ncbi:MAG TPA: ribosomal protein S18-alanine N-acetyltransferase [Fimbriimonadaceae bacterium]|nr:ribosomal protein S18-alanine N-acetyltransferase [Fimbriimonadaceae bacterium]
MNLRFEKLNESHLESILAIEKLSNSAPWSERSFRGELTNPQSVFVTAIGDGKVIGYAGLWIVVDEGHITTVAVDPDYRRKGIGKRLTTEVLSRAKELGIACATLEVRASNEAAINLYEGLGFVQSARRKGYYPDNREDAIVMWKHSL